MAVAVVIDVSCGKNRNVCIGGGVGGGGVSMRRLRELNVVGGSNGRRGPNGRGEPNGRAGPNRVWGSTNGFGRVGPNVRHVC